MTKRVTAARCRRRVIKHHERIHRVDQTASAQYAQVTAS